MHGNVWEWCLDDYQDKLVGGNDPQGFSLSSYKVRRGGSWKENAGLCRSAQRSRAESSDGFSSDQGFRVAGVLPEI
jgi:formylglycine-generating enzyme required for sulfatase activity